MKCTKQINARKIRDAVREHGALTRREIAEVTGLENGEVSARVHEMLGKILIERGQKLSPITLRPVGLIRLAKRRAA